MPTFKADWIKAKAAFEKTTSAKKPSASFLGVFKKGSGIAAALESCDKAKTSGELYKCMKGFKTAYDDYVKTLDKAIADPKVTPTVDKPAYAAAVKKLKDDLKAIHDSAGKTAQAILGTHKTDKVDTGRLREKTSGAPGKGAKYRDVAIDHFHQQRKLLLAMVQSNPGGLDNDQFENAEISITKMAKSLKTLEEHAKKKPMSEQFAKFQAEWTKAEEGKSKGTTKVAQCLIKMGATKFGEPDVKNSKSK